MSAPLPPDHDPLFSADDAFVATCLKMLRGELDETGCHALAQQLDGDADKRRLYVQLAVQSQLIGEVLSLHPVDEEVDESQDPYAADIMAEVIESIRMQQHADQVAKEAADKAAQEKAKSERARRERLRLAQQVSDRPVPRVIIIPKLVAMLGVAAVLLVVAGVIFEATKPKALHSPENIVESPVQPRVETPTIYPVATLLAARQPVWGEQGVWPQIGGGLLPGQYELVSGAVQVEFNSGATILVEAPARFELIDANAGRMELGALTAYVPQGAEGFAVTTPGAVFVDLGTEFGVRVSQAGDIQSHVFDGEVSATVSSRQSSGSPIFLREEEGLAVADGAVTQQPQPAGFIRRLDDDDYRAQITGDVEQVFAPPASLGMDRYQNDEIARLIVESRGVQLRGDERLTATISSPGQMQQPPQSQGLALGTVAVDSFLLHFDVATDLPLETEQTVTGEIRFPRPVLAVQCGLEDLRAGDAFFSAAGTTYHIPDSSRGWYGGPIEQAVGDWLWLSEDRRTIRFQIKAHNTDQCRILIEAAQPRETEE